MTQLPTYFTDFEKIFSLDVIHILEGIENSFHSVFYDAHFDDIHYIFDTPDNKTSSDLAGDIFHLYREHINAILSMQGIRLSNPFMDSLHKINLILNCVCILGTNKLEEVLEGAELNTENSGTTYFASIINFMTDLSVEEVLSMVKDVSPSTINKLHSEEIFQLTFTNMSVKGEERFKESGISLSGYTANIIKVFNKFGYNAHVAYKALIQDIGELNNPVELSKEIILLVLGSNSYDDELKEISLELSGHLLLPPEVIIKVNNEINKYFASREIPK